LSQSELNDVLKFGASELFAEAKEEEEEKKKKEGKEKEGKEGVKKEGKEGGKKEVVTVVTQEAARWDEGTKATSKVIVWGDDAVDALLDRESDDMGGSPRRQGQLGGLPSAKGGKKGGKKRKAGGEGEDEGGEAEDEGTKKKKTGVQGESTALNACSECICSECVAAE
jgi:hypothetical protein